MHDRYTVVMFHVDDRGHDEMRRVIKIAMSLVHNGNYHSIVAGESYYYVEENGQVMICVNFVNL